MIIPDYRDFQNRNELYHFGIKGKSGRYPLGSGERPYQDYPGKRKQHQEKRKTNDGQNTIKNHIATLNKVIKEKQIFKKVIVPELLIGATAISSAAFLTAFGVPSSVFSLPLTIGMATARASYNKMES